MTPTPYKNCIRSLTHDGKRFPGWYGAKVGNRVGTVFPLNSCRHSKLRIIPKEKPSFCRTTTPMGKLSVCMNAIFPCCGKRQKPVSQIFHPKIYTSFQRRNICLCIKGDNTARTVNRVGAFQTPEISTACTKQKRPSVKREKPSYLRAQKALCWPTPTVILTLWQHTPLAHIQTTLPCSCRRAQRKSFLLLISNTRTTQVWNGSYTSGKQRGLRITASYRS